MSFTFYTQFYAAVIKTNINYSNSNELELNEYMSKCFIFGIQIVSGRSLSTNSTNPCTKLKLPSSMHH